MREGSKIQEVCIYYVRPTPKEVHFVKNPQTAVVLFREFINPQIMDYKEFCWVMLLSKSRQVLGISQIAAGSTSAALINKKEIFQLALKTNASYILICHNHPSGSLKPSKGDFELTQEIFSFGSMIDIEVLDHIIITSESYYSFAEDGLIPSK